MPSNNVVPIAILSRPDSPPIWWWPEDLPSTGGSAGKPSGAGQLLLCFFFLSTRSTQSGLQESWGSAQRASGAPPWQAWRLSSFCPEVPCFRSLNNVHLFIYSRPTMCQALATKTKETELVSMPTARCI